nr:MAG TPA: hypothetical protein [Caudoviricetes sp.]
MRKHVSKASPEKGVSKLMVWTTVNKCVVKDVRKVRFLPQQFP